MSETTPSRARRASGSAVWMALAAIAAGLVTLTLFSGLLVIHRGIPHTRPLREPPPAALATLEEFLHAADREDVDFAYALLSPDVREFLSLHELANMFERTGWIGRFDGFERLTVDLTEYRTRRDLNPDYRFRVLWLEGGIIYGNAPDVTFEAVMELVEGVWVLADLWLDSAHRDVYDEFHEV